MNVRSANDARLVEAGRVGDARLAQRLVVAHRRRRLFVGWRRRMAFRLLACLQIGIFSVVMRCGIEVGRVRIWFARVDRAFLHLVGHSRRSDLQAICILQTKNDRDNKLKVTREKK